MLGSAAVLNPAALCSSGPSVILSRTSLSFSLCLHLRSRPSFLLHLLTLPTLFLLFPYPCLFFKVKIQTPYIKETRGEKKGGRGGGGGRLESLWAYVKQRDSELLSTREKKTPKKRENLTLDTSQTLSCLQCSWGTNYIMPSSAVIFDFFSFQGVFLRTS